MNPTYDIDYCLAKFRAIPDQDWAMDAFVDDSGRRCALGHCGCCYSENGNDEEITPEGAALVAIFLNVFKAHVSSVNDSDLAWKVHGKCPDWILDLPTPRARILAALEEAKRRQTNPQNHAGDALNASRNHPDGGGVHQDGGLKPRRATGQTRALGKLCPLPPHGSCCSLV